MEERKKKTTRKTKTRQRLIAEEKLNDGVKTESHKLQILTTVELVPPTNQSVRNLANRNS